jgi:hypothetical protein
VHVERSREGEGWVDNNLHPCRRSTRSSASSGDGFALAAMQRGSASEREWSGGEWATGGGFQRGLELIFRNGELGLGWFSSDAIGRRGRCFWTASCTDSREHEENVGGCLARSKHERVQYGCGRIGAWLERHDRQGGWARVSACWGHGAVHRRAWYGVGACARARERGARSGSAGRLGCVRVARPLCGAGWVRGGGVPRN